MTRDETNHEYGTVKPAPQAGEETERDESDRDESNRDEGDRDESDRDESERDEIERDEPDRDETSPLLDHAIDGSNSLRRASTREDDAKSAIVSSSLKFVLMVGCMSFFADFTYEGSRGIIGQYLRSLGAGPLAISIITGFGELLGYALRMVSGRTADQTGMYWPIAIAGYTLQMTVVPLLALARDWRAAGVLIILERVGKATRNPSRDAMLAHAAKQIGYGWAFGMHEALDQSGAMFGPLFVSLILKFYPDNYQFAFALLAIPGGLMLGMLTVARLLYPRPEDLERIHSRTVHSDRLPRAFWIYLAAAALVAAGFADYPMIAYNFERPGSGVPVGLIPVLYAMAMAVSGLGSLTFGRLFDRVGIVLLVPLTLVTAFYAPLVFSESGGLAVEIIGAALWGLGMGVHESIIPAAVAPMVAPDRRASAYGLFTGTYGIAWFIGSTVIGALYNVSLPAVAIFAVIADVAAIPLLLLVRRFSVPRNVHRNVQTA